MFFYFRRAEALTESDYVLLADFVNTTGDAVFDGTLKQALAVKLEESPFLNIVPDARVRETLKLMNRPAEERITGGVAREICERQGIKAMLEGSIAGLGTNYVITLNAMNCRTGDSLAREQVEAASKEEVLGALDKAASRLRGKLGESLSMVEKYDTPIEQATTSSLEALKAFSLGDATRATGQEPQAIPFYKRAIELDPTFALAYARLGTVYGNIGESELSEEYRKKAFELRDRVSEHEKLYITAHYFNSVTGEIDQARETYELWTRTYPRDSTPYNNLAVIYNELGQYEKVIEAANEANRLEPNSPFPYSNLAGAYMALNRFEEAKAICEKEIAQGIDDGYAHVTLYQIAFIQGERAAMEQHARWAAGKVEEGWMLFTQAEAAAFYGKLKEARQLYGRSIEIMQRYGMKEPAAGGRSLQAGNEARVGNYQQAREGVRAALAMSPGRWAKMGAAITLALVGDLAQAESLVNQLANRFPKTDLLFNARDLPSLRARIALQRGNPTEAIELLRPVASYELTEGGGVIFVRGQAYLRAGKGAEAAGEFKKVLDHRGLNPIGLGYPLAHLGLAQAYAMAGDTAKARTAYQDFFALWKDADPDIPILQEAKREYEKLK
ncbi:MAG: tetratricopeptide repeat protein [Acidobacteria bacterium]|nr:tetratricopeptide repeat protein [Acidobacteriota bacterium]